MIDDTLLCPERLDEVMFDPEHFFDGYKNNPNYAINTIKAIPKWSKMDSFMRY